MRKLTLKYAGTASIEDFAGVENPEGNILFDSYWLCGEDGQAIVRSQRADLDDVVDWLKDHNVDASLRKKLCISRVFFRIAEDIPGIFCIRYIIGMPQDESQVIEIYKGD